MFFLGESKIFHWHKAVAYDWSINFICHIIMFPKIDDTKSGDILDSQIATALKPRAEGVRTRILRKNGMSKRYLNRNVVNKLYYSEP